MDTSRENLESIFNEFAAKICKRHGIRFLLSDYKVIIDEDMIPDFLVQAGNPVLIRIHMRCIADALLNNRMIALKHQLQRALEVSSKKMVHTLNQTPAAPFIKKDVTDPKWIKLQNIDKQLPELLPVSRVTFSVYISVTVVDTETGITWTEKGYQHKVSIGELERKAWRELSREVLHPTPESVDANSQNDS